MTIKEVATKFDITTDTLRYYERIGLIPEVPRTAAGIRDFDEVSIKWIEFVLCFKKGRCTFRRYCRICEACAARHWH